MWDPKHLSEVKQPYFTHFLFAQKCGVVLIVAGLASMVHGLIPPLFSRHEPY